MNEEKIRQIAREEFAKLMEQDYDSGDSTVKPHKHDGVSNTRIDPASLGFPVIPQGNQKISYNYQSTSNGLVLSNSQEVAYGFGSPSILSPATSGHLQQYVQNPATAIVPIPIVVGNGVGIQSAFNGGAAPDGTMVAFLTGSTTTSALYIRWDGSWYGVVLSATPVTP